MEPIVSELLAQSIKKWKGQPIYVHLEVNPGGYIRNGKATLHEAHVKGDRSYRVYLELDDKKAIIHVDNLTHMKITKTQIILMGYDEHQRLARALEISCEPFRM